MNIKKDILQRLYDIMSYEKGVHDEVDRCFKKVKDEIKKCIINALEKDTKDDTEVMYAVCDLEKAAFIAGANMVLDFISGNEV